VDHRCLVGVDVVVVVDLDGDGDVDVISPPGTGQDIADTSPYTPMTRVY